MTGRDQRASDAARRVELTQQAARHEAAIAQALIDRFVEEARAAGLKPVPLRATTLDGHSVRTNKTGWYLRHNKSLAVGSDGGYYVLTVPGGLRERLRGVALERTLPSLQVGKGGRDGETGDLREFLAWVLNGEIPQT